MNIPRKLVILILLAIIWFLVFMMRFADKKVLEFDKGTTRRINNIEESID